MRATRLGKQTNLAAEALADGSLRLHVGLGAASAAAVLARPPVAVGQPVREAWQLIRRPQALAVAYYVNGSLVETATLNISGSFYDRGPVQFGLPDRPMGATLFYWALKGWLIVKEERRRERGWGRNRGEEEERIN